MSKLESINQTQFSFEEPIFENPTEIPVEPKIDDGQSKNKKKMIAIIGGFFGLLCIILLVILTRPAQEIAPEVVEDLPQEVVAIDNTDPIFKGIQSLRAELSKQDPTKRDLSFPPVNLEIWLDPKPRL